MKTGNFPGKRNTRRLKAMDRQDRFPNIKSSWGKSRRHSSPKIRSKKDDTTGPSLAGTNRSATCFW